MGNKIFLHILAIGMGVLSQTALVFAQNAETKPRVIITTDGEIDDECSMVRFLLYANEFDIEGIVTTSSQYHWQGHKWAGDDWLKPYLDAYAKVFPNLILHDGNYPKPEYLTSVNILGNVSAEGEMETITAGSELIVKALLKNDPRPIWIQAWGGVNTIARALKTIEEKHPEKLSEVARKLRLYLIWEQDNTFQSYIRPHWRKYNIETIISDQFVTYFYTWKKFLPEEAKKYLVGDWMKPNILENHGQLCTLYKSHPNGDFRSEGDSPAFLHTIPNGLRSMESPDFGGWGGRYVKIRENTWLDPVLEPNYTYSEGRWWTNNAWGRQRMKKEIENDSALQAYLQPTSQWIPAIQNDFAARADWCVKPFTDANHPPKVSLKTPINLAVKPKQKVILDASATSDPDGDNVFFNWYAYPEAGTYKGQVKIEQSNEKKAKVVVPSDAQKGDTIHLICEVNDGGTPQLTRYQRVILTID